MSEWTTRTISEAAEILDSMRVPVSEAVRTQSPGATPYYGANGLQGYIAGHLFDEPLVLIAEDGGYFDEFSTRPIAYRINGKSWVNNHAHILRPRANTDFDFLFYSLEHKNIVPFIKGGTRAKLNQAELREIEIRIPSQKNAQRKIGAILASIDSAIEAIEALIKKHQQVKAGLMHDLFTRGALDDGQVRPSAHIAPGVYQESLAGRIPRSWRLAPLGEVCSVIVDCPHSTPSFQADGVLVARTMHIKDGTFLEAFASRVVGARVRPASRACSSSIRRCCADARSTGRRGLCSTARNASVSRPTRDAVTPESRLPLVGLPREPNLRWIGCATD